MDVVEDALVIYARMNDDERTGWIHSAMGATVDSTTAGRLPRIDPDEFVARLRQAVQDGSLDREPEAADEEEASERGAPAEAAAIDANALSSPSRRIQQRIMQELRRRRGLEA